MDKRIGSIQEAIRACGLKSGMTVSFHHHFRNGDYVMNLVMGAIDAMGLHDICVCASAVYDCHAPMIDLMRRGVITKFETSYMSSVLGKAVTEGVLKHPVMFRSHGGRPAAILSGETHIDVAFIAASAADPMGNCSGREGPTACGALGYPVADAMCADKVVVITDHLEPYPLRQFSIPEQYVDYVVTVDQIGDPNGIIAGITRLTRDPIALQIAQMAVKTIACSGLLKDGFSFQTGGGGATLAVASYLREVMLKQGVKGSFAMGGVTKYLVDMLHDGCFQTLLDAQCFDLDAVRSLREDPAHLEISAIQYASPTAKSAAVDSLDVTTLGATQIDTDFNVNVNTTSDGYIMGGSGGHSDCAAGASMTVILMPLVRRRLPMVVDRVACITTPGKTVDVLVTQCGIAVNPARPDLRQRFLDAKLPVVDIEELKRTAYAMTGVPELKPTTGRVVANVQYRDGQIIDQIRQR